MTKKRYREGAVDDFFAHPLDQRQRGGLAILAEDFAESGCQRGFGDDVGFDAGGDAFGPGFVVALDSGQALFLANQRIDVAHAVFNRHFHHLFRRPAVVAMA